MKTTILHALSRRAGLLTALLATIAPASAGAQAPTWTAAWSLAAEGTEHPIGIETDADGNLYVGGYSNNPNLPDHHDPVSQFVASTGPNGEVRWIRTILSDAPSLPAHMDVDADGNVYVAATFTGPFLFIDQGGFPGEITGEPGDNIIVMKYDSDGMLEWTLTVGGGDTLTATGIAVTGDAIWVAGTFTESVEIGATRLTSAGGSDAFVAVVTNEGTVRSAMRGGGSGTDQCHAIAAAPNGDVVALGLFNASASFGERTINGTGSTDFFLTRYRPDGTVAWARADGGPSFIPATNFARRPLLLTVDRDGAACVGISYLGGIRIGANQFPAVSEADAVVAKYGPDGVPVWAAQLGGQLLQLIQGLTTDSDGSIYIDGFSQAIQTGTVFVSKLSAQGAGVWDVTNQWGNALGNANGGPICVDVGGRIYLSGAFGGQTRFGAYNLTSQGSSPTAIQGDDIYVAELESTSGVKHLLRHDETTFPFTTTQRDDMLFVRPQLDAPPITEAALYSMLGERVGMVSGISGNEIRFNVAGLAPGAYMIALRAPRGSISHPVMIVR